MYTDKATFVAGTMTAETHGTTECARWQFNSSMVVVAQFHLAKRAQPHQTWRKVVAWYVMTSGKPHPDNFPRDMLRNE